MKNMRHSRPRGAARLVCLVLAACVLLPGCASKYGTQTTQVNHYPDCYAPINELRGNEYYVEKSAAAGAVGGAVLGALIGYLATGKGEGAAAGAVAGGIAGGAAGGIYAHHQKQANDSARLSEYNASLDGNIREVDKATAAARVARQCYERQFTTATSEFKAGHITRAQFNSRYQEVVQGLEEAAAILGETNRNSSQVAGEYKKAIDREEQEIAQKNAQKRTGSGSETRQVAELKQKSADLNRSVDRSRDEERELRKRLATTHQQAKDLMS